MNPLEINSVEEVKECAKAALETANAVQEEFRVDHELHAQVDGVPIGRVGARPIVLAKGAYKEFPAWIFTGDIALPNPREPELGTQALAHSLRLGLSATHVAVVSVEELSANVIAYWIMKIVAAPAAAP